MNYKLKINNRNKKLKIPPGALSPPWGPEAPIKANLGFTIARARISLPGLEPL
jgi:hypothetical protein